MITCYSIGDYLRYTDNKTHKAQTSTLNTDSEKRSRELFNICNQCNILSEVNLSV